MGTGEDEARPPKYAHIERKRGREVEAGVAVWSLDVFDGSLAPLAIVAIECRDDTAFKAQPGERD